MKNSIITGVFVGLLGTSGFAHAADFPPKIEAVKQYLLQHDYLELFGDKSYRIRVNNAIVSDLDGDGEEEVILHVTPHYFQSPTIIIFKVSNSLNVTRVIEGLAPGPLLGLSSDFIDSHTLGEGVDFIIGKEQKNAAKRKQVVKLTLERMGGVVEYVNFIHMDGREGKGSYVDMTNLAKPPTKDNCEAFEFSMPDEVTVRPKNDGSGNDLLARVGGAMYAYKIHKIGDDGFLEKTLKVTFLKK